MADPPDECFTSVNGNSFHYRDWGGAGQPIVLVHGLASNCRIWDLVAPILAREFRVIALDQRGHGQSFKPDTGYDFATVVADLDGLIDTLTITNPVIVGHSWGGDVALEYDIAYPGKAKGLCFVDGGTIDISGRADWTLEDAKREMAPPLWTGVTLEAFRARLKSRSIAMDNPHIQDVVLANFETQNDGTIMSRLSRENHFRIIEALWDHRPSELYPNVGCPVLLMPARQKGDDSPQARRFRREEAIARAESLLPKGKTVWMEDSIHDVPIQRPRLVASTIANHINDGFFG
ncbi:MAG: alpha/beta hydrolase [Dehalococcoidia bacterium]|nr:alpha/beta hydrolase [Dehalococcoidia bacterium]